MIFAVDQRLLECIAFKKGDCIGDTHYSFIKTLYLYFLHFIDNNNIMASERYVLPKKRI
jgi:hypothetical protein